MLFKEKLISDHENEALGHNSLILFSVEIDDPVNLVKFKNEHAKTISR